jgi:hypothetical protein
MLYEEIIAKLLSQTEGVISEDKAHKLIELVENLENLPDISGIVQLLH